MNGNVTDRTVAHMLSIFSGIAWMIMLYKMDLWKSIEKTTKIWVYAALGILLSGFR